MAASNGDLVKVHYTGTLEDGTQFDSSIGREPLEFALGQGQLIPGFEDAIIGKEKGDRISVSIPPEKAYGQPDEELIFRIPRSQFPKNIEPKTGMHLELGVNQDANHDPDAKMSVVITEVTPDEVTLDANMPLAGKTLNFDIEILDLKKADN